MSDRVHATGRVPWAWPPTVRTAAAIITALGLALLATGCGGAKGSATVPAGSKVTQGSGSASRAGSTSSQSPSAMAFATCVRSHGVPNFPDPNASGVFPKSPIPGVTQAQIRAAENPCAALLPATHPYTLTARDKQDYLKAAACMRSHGIVHFPDPNFSGGTVNLSIPSSIDQNSTQFKQAAQICEQLIPAGLPYSGSG